MNILELIGSLTIALLFGLMASFIAINLLSGCEDWSEPNCITPKMIYEEIFE